MSGTLVLSRRLVGQLLTLDECIEAVERAFVAQALGQAPPAGILGQAVAGGGFHVKTALLPGERPTFAAKINANFPGNPRAHGLPTIQGVVVLYDAVTGTPLALMDSGELTMLRTAAASAVAARRLAREDARVLTVVGCGRQGGAHARALARVRRLERVHLVDADPERARRLAAELGSERGIPGTPGADLAAATRASDLVATCTTSRVPLLGPGMLRPGAFVAAVGADNEEKHEIAPALLAASTVVVDSLEQCATIGDLHHALAAGAMTRAAVHAELGEVLAGRRPGRRAGDETIVFDSTGTAIQDVAAASLVLERARRAGVGHAVDLAN